MLVVLKEKETHPTPVSSQDCNTQGYRKGNAGGCHERRKGVYLGSDTRSLPVLRPRRFAPQRKVPGPLLVRELAAPVAPEEKHDACDETGGHQGKPWKKTPQHYFTPCETSYDAGMP
ncbi:MAG: hypothetical protein ABSG49_12155, partial [Methanoregula sp.]|uniref:hypothetical protein n=1 Tax=Methanoregula sp. TaxID=2052170 RepID=UPI003C248264